MHKAEALNVLTGILKRLEAPEPLDGLARRLFRASVEYAIEQIEQIQEVKRRRSHG